MEHTPLKDRPWMPLAMAALGLLLKIVEQGLEAGEVAAPGGSAHDRIPVQLRVAVGVKRPDSPA